MTYYLNQKNMATSTASHCVPEKMMSLSACRRAPKSVKARRW